MVWYDSFRRMKFLERAIYVEYRLQLIDVQCRKEVYELMPSKIILIHGADMDMVIYQNQSFILHFARLLVKSSVIQLGRHFTEHMLVKIACPDRLILRPMIFIPT